MLQLIFWIALLTCGVAETGVSSLNSSALNNAAAAAPSSKLKVKNNKTSSATSLEKNGVLNPKENLQAKLANASQEVIFHENGRVQVGEILYISEHIVLEQEELAYERGIEWQEEHGEEKIPPSDFEFWINVIVASICVATGGVMSGLTIGLFSLDPMKLVSA